MLPLVGGLTGALALTGMAVAPAANATGDFAPTGSAFAIKSEVSLLNGTVGLKIAPQPKASYPAGADKSLIKVTGQDVLKGTNIAPNSKLELGVLNASSDLKDGKLKSEASVADLKLKLEDVLKLSAKLVEAHCVATPQGVKGGSNLVDLKVGGQLIDADAVVANPNTVVEVKGVGKVILNEQKETEDGLTVNAIHVKLNAVEGVAPDVVKGDIIISQAKCSTKGGPSVEPSPEPSEPSGNPSTPPSDGNGPSTPPAGGDNGGNNGGNNGGDNGGNNGGDNGGNNGQNSDLAKTGANGLLPIAGAAAGLLAVGGGALYLARRRKANA
ncbi:hypothetical protein TH66_21505 [Carbonactinospora thermoautotrophica]|nr:hypothetical protein TH66_21505 [Carbonactinospora thermoautotrophica]KWX09645.1 hypothetical protein TR74_08345 [Carbonactinospora thermoautotrophica]